MHATTYCCPVCLDDYAMTRSDQLSCGHYICKSCRHAQTQFANARLQYNALHGTAYAYFVCPYRCAVTAVVQPSEASDDGTTEPGWNGHRIKRTVCFFVCGLASICSAAYVFDSMGSLPGGHA